MSQPLHWNGATQARDTPAWGAVFSMTLGVFGLVTAEFLPASLLTPMAADLRITEGVAGQAVTATAVVGMITSLLISAATRRLDRRTVLLSFSVLLIVSNLVVAFAPDLPFLLLGRFLLGMAIGGFWTMSAAVTMRLVPEALVPKALSMIFSGVSAATILAAPVGSYLGAVIGWRSVFLLIAALGLVTLVVQFATLPRMAPSSLTRLRTLADVLVRPGVGLGMVAAMLVFTGHFAFFTYVRPFIESVPGVGINMMSAILLGFGIANFLGTLVAGPLIERSLRVTLMTMPLLMGVLGLGLIVLSDALTAVSVLIALWGMAFGAVPVAWSTWLTRTVPDQAESAGGLLVAAIQFAIAIGAAMGGMIFDMSGVTGVFAASSAVLLLTALIILAGIRPRRVAAMA
ncbi:MAG TPA: MFS transporter [Microvirga sp.]|nr:MFS transporter [Microvirga sp.]